MPKLSTKPYLAIYVAWHPEFDAGSKIADALYNHYRRNLFVNVAGGAGISVIFRSAPSNNRSVPIDIDFNDAETTAVVVLVDENIEKSPEWIDYIQKAVSNSAAMGHRTGVFPVAINKNAYKIGEPASDLNFIRWDGWFGDAEEDKHRKLIFQLTYQFCRLLRVSLALLDHPSGNDEFETYLQRVRIFLSHSKHDLHGEKIAKKIKQSIFNENDLDAFFDVTNIPPGLRFADVLVHNIKVSAVVAIHTDSFSSREWCRREVLAAKRHNVPFVVANCIVDYEERGFPYMGNVPVIRMEPDEDHRISIVIARLLDEVLRAFLWICRIELAKKIAPPSTAFLPRPPELVSLVTMLQDHSPTPDTIVYPDPPLGAEELALFESLSDNLNLQSYTQWAAAGAV